MTNTSPEYWQPSSDSIVTGAFLDDDCHVLCWSKARTTNTLTILVVDDVWNPVINGPASFPIGSDEYAVRRAIESLLADERVGEIIFADFLPGVIETVDACRPTAIGEHRLCILLDVFGPDNLTPHGLYFVPYIRKWDLPPCNHAQFSKKGHQDFDAMAFEWVMKPKEVQSERAYEDMAAKLRSWIDTCFKPFESVFVSNAGDDVLASIGAFLRQRYHIPGRHDIEECLAHAEEAKRELLSYQLEVVAYENALSEKPHFDNDVRKKLLLPLTNVDCAGLEVSFALSKTLSRNGRDRTYVPGYWLEVAMGADASVGLGRLWFPFKNKSPQPIAGFLEALRSLARMADPEIRLALNSLDLVCQIDILVKKDQDIAPFQTIVTGIFEGAGQSQGAGEASQTFQALYRAGVKLKECTLSEGKLSVVIVFEMGKVP